MKQAKKNTKVKSRYYTVRTIRESVEDLADNLNDYHTRYIKKPVESGREFVGDARKKPRKVLGTMIDDGKGYVEDFGKDTRKKFKNVVDDSRSFLQKSRRNPRKTAAKLVDDSKSRVTDFKTDLRRKIDDYVDNTREMVEGVEKDVRLIMDDLLENSRKTIDRIPGKKAVEKTIRKQMKSLPAQLNMPARDELEKLGSRVQTLHQNVEALHKQLAA